MENPEKGHFNDQLRDQTISLSIRVYNLFQDKKLSILIRPIVNQIIRSSSSVAANFRAATRARAGILTQQEIGVVQQEMLSLLRIFSATKKTMKEKLRV